MTIIRQYFEFIDRPTNEVKIHWKALQILAYAITAIASYTTSWIFAVIRHHFDNNCFLFARIIFLPDNSTSNDTTPSPRPDNNFRLILQDIDEEDPQNIDERSTIWGPDQICDFCYYVPIMSAITAIILLVFFSMCPRGGSRNSTTGLNRSWHLVLPAFVISTIFIFVLLSLAIETENGIKEVCEEISREYNVSRCNFDLTSVYNAGGTIRRLVSLHFGLYISLLMWVFATVLLLVRMCCGADFKFVQVTISTLEEKKVTFEDTEVLLEDNESPHLISQL